MEESVQPPSDPKDVEMEHNISRAVRSLGKLHIHVSGGHVTVSGIVDDYGTKRQIASTIQSMGGVREVTNNIRVSQE